MKQAHMSRQPSINKLIFDARAELDGGLSQGLDSGGALRLLVPLDGLEDQGTFKLLR